MPETADNQTEDRQRTERLEGDSHERAANALAMMEEHGIDASEVLAEIASNLEFRSLDFRDIVDRLNAAVGTIIVSAKPANDDYGAPGTLWAAIRDVAMVAEWLRLETSHLSEEVEAGVHSVVRTREGEPS